MSKMKVLIQEAKEAAATKLQVSAAVGMAMLVTYGFHDVFPWGADTYLGMMSKRNVKCNPRL
jgi:hypothetical protein